MASVREGVKRLEQLRLVETRHGDGMRVADWRAGAGSTCSCTRSARAARSTPALIAEVFEARRLLLAEAAALAARGARDDAGRAARAELAGDLRRRADDATAQGLDLAFMATVIEAAGNLASR